MKVTVKLFAAAREKVGADQVELQLPAACTVGGLKQQMSESYPALRPLLAHVLFAVDTQYANDDTPLTDQSEIACIPPVSGG